MRALIVDDEEDIGLMVSRFLQKEGIETACASNIEDARELISSQTFDVYYLDLNLPDGSGFDIVPQIRSDNTRARVIIVSAYDGVEENRRARELGVDQFIKKPFSRQEVIEAATP